MWAWKGKLKMKVKVEQEAKKVFLCVSILGFLWKKRKKKSRFLSFVFTVSDFKQLVMFFVVGRNRIAELKK